MLSLGEKMVTYYLDNARPLPWRVDKDPYKIHVSETMLQQTRVETVIPYFEAFLKDFPIVSALASSEEERVLKRWEGLGYYSRAKNLLKAARKVVSDFKGVYPNEKESLLALPGVGEYTANAILSFCFDVPAIPVDGNFLRLFARLVGYKDNVLDPKAKRLCEEFFLSRSKDTLPSDFAQAAMEIGEVICLPNGEPKCAICPLRDECFAFAHNLAQSLPLREKAKGKKEEDKTVIVFNFKGRYGYCKRPEKGLLSGLYGFPLKDGFLSKKRVKQFAKELGCEVKHIALLEDYQHVFSHVKWSIKGYLVEVATLPEESGLVFLTPKERAEKIALPSAFIPFEKQLK